MTKFSLDPTTNSYIVVKLFRNVKNIVDLRKKVMSGQLQCCFVNPKIIVHPFQLVIAANKALTSETLTTRTVCTEILFNLSISKNISKSLQQFGIADDNQDLLVLTVNEENKDEQNDRVFGEVQGEEVDLSCLGEVHDLELIKNVYKIGELEERCSTILDSIVSRIVTKDFISY